MALPTSGIHSICLESRKDLEQSGVSKRWDFEEAVIGAGSSTWSCLPASFQPDRKVSSSEGQPRFWVFRVSGTGEGEWLPQTPACQVWVCLSSSREKRLESGALEGSPDTWGTEKGPR